MRSFAMHALGLFDNFRQGGDVRREHRRATRHGFQRRQPEAFVERRAHQGQTDYKLDVMNHRPIGAATAWTIEASQEPVLTLSGWAVDREAGGPASGVFINVDGQQDFRAEYSQDRLDVAVFFGRPAYRHSGFIATLPVERLGLGTHLLRLNILSVDRRQYSWSEHTWTVHIR